MDAASGDSRILRQVKLSSLHDVISRDNAVGIATRYGLDVKGNECR